MRQRDNQSFTLECIKSKLKIVSLKNLRKLQTPWYNAGFLMAIVKGVNYDAFGYKAIE